MPLLRNGIYGFITWKLIMLYFFNISQLIIILIGKFFARIKDSGQLKLSIGQKKETLNFFEKYVGNDAFMTFRKILGGCILVKKAKPI